MPLREDQDLAVPAQFDRCPETGDSAADDEKIRGGKRRRTIGRHNYFRPTPEGWPVKTWRLFTPKGISPWMPLNSTDLVPTH